MSFNKKEHKNLLLNQIDSSGKLHINELVPPKSNNIEDIKFLSFNEDIQWSSIKSSHDIIITSQPNGDITLDVSVNAFEGTEMFFSDGQIGIGRIPLHEYKIDVGVPVNTRMTAMHIGDGTFGFSFGNATDSGFLPQIIGLGSDEDDAGLYFLGKISSSEGSDIPAIIFDGRDIYNNALTNRPILGISSGSYSEYKVLVDSSGRVGIGTIPNYELEVNGDIRADNIIIDSSSGISDLKQELEDLKQRLYNLENN